MREAGGLPTWLLPDRLGSARAKLDAAGAVAARYDYDPYGVPAGTSAPADYGYAGEPRDAGTGLVHLRARWYQPAQRRFLSRDPWAGDAGAPQTLHPYAYAHNDPANGTDPTGWARLLCGDGALGGVAGLALAADPVLPFRPGKLCPVVDRHGRLVWVPCEQGQPGIDIDPAPAPPCPQGGCKPPGGRGAAVVIGAAIATIVILLTPSHTEQDDDGNDDVVLIQFENFRQDASQPPTFQRSLRRNESGISVARLDLCPSIATCFRFVSGRDPQGFETYRSTTRGILEAPDTARIGFTVIFDGNPFPAHATVTLIGPRWTGTYERKFDQSFGPPMPIPVR